jgi:NAD(P)-dependent dehydrogenase (short-subunit alcohol dehydrogenase family)
VDERNPRPGPRVADDVPAQDPPGVEGKLRPRADHGEESYRGSGRLADLAALITGGDSGIGRAVALAFAREGADVAITYFAEEEEEDAAETARWIEVAGRKAVVRRLDQRDPGACRSAVDAVAEELGRLDILVNNAAYQMERESILDITPEELQKTFATNIFGFFYMTQAALRHLKPGAVILNTGSVTALEGHASLLDYSSTKGAIHVFTKGLAQQLAEDGIRVNCVAPGPVWTPLIPATLDIERVPEFGEDTLWGRPAQPAEIAPAFVFLASADSRYFTGEILAPTGRTATTR